MTPLLSVRNLTAQYGRVRALHGLSFEIEDGTVTALLGANGAGKTTTLRAICNMIAIGGEVLFDGITLKGRPTARTVDLGIVHVPQGRGTFTTLTTEENLKLGAITRRNRAAIASDMERMYATFPVLRERRLQQAGLLSGGEQQMLAIARALMRRPRLMLLDEPSFGLAPIIVRDLFNTLATINREQNVSILVVEQNMQLALQIASHAHVIETGRIVLSGTAEDISRNDDVRRSYLGY